MEDSGYVWRHGTRFVAVQHTSSEKQHNMNFDGHQPLLVVFMCTRWQKLLYKSSVPRMRSPVCSLLG